MRIEKTVGHTGIARLCLTQKCHRTRTDDSLLAKGSPTSTGGEDVTIRTIYLLFAMQML